MKTVKILTWNVKGTGCQVKRKRIEMALRKDKADLIFLQETHQKSAEDNKLFLGWTNIYEKSYGTSKSRGVAIFISRRLGFHITKTISDPDGRFLIIKGNMEEEEVLLVNVYVPNRNQERFLSHLSEIVEKERTQKMIVAGDFNLIRSSLDTTNMGRTGYLNKAQTLDNWMSSLGLKDTWREIYGLERTYTFYSQVYNTYSRIDYVLVSEGLIKDINEIRVGTFKESDHAKLVLEMNIQEQQTLARSWRYDSSLFSNPENKKKLIKAWEEFWKNNDNGEVGLNVVWDAMKAVIRGECIQISSINYKQNKAKYEAVEGELKRLQQEHTRTKNRLTYDRIQKLKNELVAKDIDKVKRDLIYLKRNYFEFSNKNSKMLARAAKEKRESREMGVLLDKNGKRLNKIQDKLNLVKDFYQDLYTRKAVDKDQLGAYIQKNLRTKIRLEHINKMEEKITEKEIREVISNLKIGKTPGEDGFCSEFYKSYKEIVIPKLLNLFNYILQGGKMPSSWFRSLITLIPKPDKDLERIESYRPISLINQDAKIFTNIMARRLNSFMGDYIKEDQAGFLKGRNMSDLTRRVCDLLELVKKNKDKVGMLSLDIFKAFDSIQWVTMKDLISKYGFGPKFKNVISQLYSQGLAKIKVNQYFTEEIRLEAGTRQGCPLSPILFILAMELLATSIREDSNIEGIKGNKISLYADDTLIILKHPLENMEKLQFHLKEFESMTGLRINWDKTEIMTCNLHWRDQQLISEKFGVSIKDNLKYLGICISNNFENLKKLNYDKQMRAIKEQIVKYNKLKLSWFGRVALCKMMLLPKINFLLDALPIPLKVKDLNSFQTVFNQFCNGGKRPRISKSLLYMPQKQGGLGIPNLQMYYKSFQIRNVVKILMEKKVIWEDIEMEDCISKGKALFLDHGDRKISCKSTMLKATWKVWQGLKKVLAPGTSPILNLQDQVNFPIKVDDKIKLILVNNNAFYLKDWLLTCRDESKRNEIYNQLGADWFLKLKLNRWNNKYLVNPSWDRDKTLFEKLIMDLRLGDNNIKGIVSKIYGILISSIDSQCSMRQIWEQDLGKSISEDIWKSLWKRRIMRNLSTRIKEHNYKIIWRWYLTPVRLNTMDKSKTNKCWRCNKMVGYYKHMWWDCEMVQLFWKKIS